MLAILLALFMTTSFDGIRQLSVPLMNWSTPDQYLTVGNPTLVELTRITGNVGMAYESTKWRWLVALQIGGEAQGRRLPNTAPVFLVIVVRPWMTIRDVHSPLVASEAAFTSTYFARIREAIAESTWKPRLVCTVDTETFSCRGSNQIKCLEVYKAYDALLRSQGCSEVHWFSFGLLPSPAPPNEFSTPAWSAPWSGMDSLGFSLAWVGEHLGKRQAAHLNRQYANSIGVTKIVGWISAPGCGRKFQWGDGLNYWPWTFNVGTDTLYDTILGRELLNWWYRLQGQRYMGAVDGVAVYPGLLDPRIIDPERKHLLAFLRGVSE